MLKKSLIAISIFCIIAIISAPVFASNMAQGAGNTLNNIKDGVQNMVNDAGNSLEKAKDGISNVVTDGANAAKNAGNDVKNAAENGMNNMTDNNNLGTNRNTNNYTATRTSATDTTTGGGLSINATIWIVMAIAGAIIVALVWYYGTQANTID